MKKLFYLLIMLSSVGGFSQAETQFYGSLPLREALAISENQNYLSQRAIKHYIYLYNNPRDKKAKSSLKSAASQFDKNLETLHLASPYPSGGISKNVEVVSHLWVEFNRIFSEKPTETGVKKVIILNGILIRKTEKLREALKFYGKVIYLNTYTGIYVCQEGSGKEILKSSVDRQLVLLERLGLYYLGNISEIYNRNVNKNMLISFVGLKSEISKLKGSILCDKKIKGSVDRVLNTYNTLEMTQSKLYYRSIFNLLEGLDNYRGDLEELHKSL